MWLIGQQGHPSWRTASKHAGVSSRYVPLEQGHNTNNHMF
jgi:glutamate/tyrosine decarboxylase-like PLP-dependent enzyme